MQEKVERLLDKHMKTIVAMAQVGEVGEWRLFRFQDRKKTDYLLSPTHEEEMTSLVAGICKSYKELPLRLYQISRKYRDEPRPRQGLLRAREFLMKDLYTFDHSPEMALKTYNEVRDAYRAFFDEFKVPYLVAEADSGAMGGSVSHEYHLPSRKGEDVVISCGECGYVANEEVAATGSPAEAAECTWSTDAADADADMRISLWSGVTADKQTLVNVFYPSATRVSVGETRNDELNVHAIKKAVPTLNAGLEDPVAAWREHFDPTSSKITNLYDARLPPSFTSASYTRLPSFTLTPASSTYTTHALPSAPQPRLSTLKPLTTDPCPRCPTGRLRSTRAIELGHTFMLGTRYSAPLAATVATPSDAASALHMGCYGIGVTRLLGALASSLADARGLNWPAAIAPFQAVIIPASQTPLEDAAAVHASLGAGVDAAIDDRAERSLPWRLADADLLGVPILLVLGRAWHRGGGAAAQGERRVEVQCRRLGVRAEVEAEPGALSAVVRGLLERL
ncbi:MAG: hypothetical protein M1832_004903 [Thelocarpon impressellum]|nr:MAG: hypothetical protein M1832_004903 [Thelocarpon impressellum]